MAGMEIAVWTVSGLLAALYLMVGTMKLMSPAKAQGMGPVMAALSPGQLRAIGGLEVFGAIGLILPPLLDIAVWLAGAAAVGLALVQVFAVPQHIKHHDTKMLPMNIMLFAAAAFVALARFDVIG